jgi:hypothetical protein
MNSICDECPCLDECDPPNKGYVKQKNAHLMACNKEE